MAEKKVDIQKVGQVSIPVHDLSKAVAFYRDTLELPFLFEAPNMAFFECNGLRLLLSIPENDQFDHPSSTIYFQVEDIQKSFETLADRGAKVLGEPHKIAEMDGVETWMAFFQDPDENVHALMSEVSVK